MAPIILYLTFLLIAFLTIRTCPVLPLKSYLFSSNETPSSCLTAAHPIGPPQPLDIWWWEFVLITCDLGTKYRIKGQVSVWTVFPSCRLLSPRFVFSCSYISLSWAPHSLLSDFDDPLTVLLQVLHVLCWTVGVLLGLACCLTVSGLWQPIVRLKYTRWTRSHPCTRCWAAGVLECSTDSSP